MLSRRNLLRFGLGACVLLAIGIAALFTRQSNRVIELANQDISCRRFRGTTFMGQTLPNCDGVRDIGEGPVPIHFNAGGFRDIDHHPLPQPGRFRIAFLGASVHVAPGLTEDLNPARLIEARLDEIGLKNVEVFNFSVEGYATVHHLARLQRYLATRPNLVVIDTLEGYKPFRDYFLRFLENPSADPGSGSPFRKPQDLLPDGWKWLFGWETAFRIFLHLKQVKEQFVATREIEKAPAGSLEQAKILLSRSLSMMNEMKNECFRSGADFVVVWSGMPLTNEVALRANESPLIAHAYGPLLPAITIPPSVGLAAITGAGQRVADISAGVPAENDARYHIGSTYYFNRAGMERYSRAVADALAPIIRQRLASRPRFLPVSAVPR